MSLRFLATGLLVGALAVLSSGCLTRRTVTRGGQTVESGYVFKRPLKEAVRNSR